MVSPVNHIVKAYLPVAYADGQRGDQVKSDDHGGVGVFASQPLLAHEQIAVAHLLRRERAHTGKSSK